MLRRATLIMAALILAFTFGCGRDNSKHQDDNSGSSLTMSPASTAVRAGDSQQFTATGGTGTTSWSVNGIAGGNATVGTISASGLYTAPATVPTPNTATVTATNGSLTANATVTLQNPIPVVSSVTPNTVNVGPVNLTVNGSKFVSGAQVLLGGTALTTTFVSSTQLTATGNAATAGAISVTVHNPDPGAITSTTSATVNVGAVGVVITGTVMKGPANGSTVTAFATKADGSNGASLGTATTDASGNFSLTTTSAPTTPVRLSVTGGTYVSENDGSTLPISQPLTALMDDASAGGSGLVISPATTLVDSLTVSDLNGAVVLPAAPSGSSVPAVRGSLTSSHGKANSAVKALWGVKGLTPFEKLLAKFLKGDITSDPDAFKLGLVNGALLDCAKKAGADATAYIAALARDISDGVFDGKDHGTPIPLGSGFLSSTAGTTDFLLCMNDYIANGKSPSDNGIAPTDVTPIVGDISTGVTSSGFTPKATGLSAGSSGAISTLAFGSKQYLFVAARDQGVVVIDITDPTNPNPTVKVWKYLSTTTFGGSVVGGVIPVVGTSSHAQVLVFAYGTKTVALVNAETLVNGTPGTDDASLVDFQTDLPLTACCTINFSGGSAFIAGGIPDNGRKGVWLATADGYAFFDLVTNTMTKLYPIENSNELAENLGGDIGHDLLFAGNYDGVQLVDLAADKSYYFDSTSFSNLQTMLSGFGETVDGDSVDSAYQVGIFTSEDTNTAAFINLASIVKTDAASPAFNTFAPAPNGMVGVTFGCTDTSSCPTLSGSAVDSSTHLVLFMAGFSTSLAVGKVQDPAAPSWQGLSDFVFMSDINNSTTISSQQFYSEAQDPHAVGSIFNIAAGKPFGYLLDGFSQPSRVIQVDLQGMLDATRAGSSGDAAHQLAGDPGAAGLLKGITWTPIP